MSDFNKAVEKVLKFEGVLSNDKYDAGGLTKYGISKRMYPTLDIANLTQEQAKDIVTGKKTCVIKYNHKR